jgi:hypothetical protein
MWGGGAILHFRVQIIAFCRWQEIIGEVMLNMSSCQLVKSMVEAGKDERFCEFILEDLVEL